MVRINSMEKAVEDKKVFVIGLIIMAIAGALIFAGLIEGVLWLTMLILTLAITNWVWILLGIAVILLIRKFFSKKKVQDMRIVK